MKLTAAKFTTIDFKGSLAIALCQHFSSSIAAGAVSFPSIVKLVDSVSSCMPILSIAVRPFTITGVKLNPVVAIQKPRTLETMKAVIKPSYYATARRQGGKRATDDFSE